MIPFFDSFGLVPQKRPGVAVTALSHKPSFETLEERLVFESGLGQGAGAVVEAPQQFILQLYHDLLNRSPRPSEVNNWEAALQSGVGRKEIAQGFVDSHEYQVQLVTGYYENYLGRQGGPDEIRGWVNQLPAGERGRSIEAGFLASDEYFSKSGGTTTGWLEILYRKVLEREADPTALDNLKQAIKKGVTREQVSLAILNSEEARTLLARRDFQKYLRREPDAAGLNSSLTLLYGGLPESQVVVRLVSSPEYYQGYYTDFTNFGTNPPPGPKPLLPRVNPSATSSLQDLSGTSRAVSGAHRRAPTGPYSILSGFNGMGFPDSGGYTPPDTVMAVGTNHIVEVINSTVAIYTKSGVNLSQMALDTFFNVPGQFLYDPVATYDEMTDRFLVGVIQLDDVAETSSFFLAVSNTGDPTAGFTQMQINLKETIGTTSYWADYPKVGWNADAYVFTFNMYSFPTSSAAFDHTQVLSVNKTTLATFRVDEPTGVFTMAAATMHGAAPGAPMYFVVGNTGGGATIDVITMTNVLSPTPTFATTTLAVNAYGAPPDAVQPGDVITTNDARMLNAEWRANRLVATHTVGAGGKAEVRWYDIDVTGAPTITQQGNVDQGAGVSTFMPAIAIAPDGSLGMSFMQCSATQFISIYVTVQTPTTPPGTMETPLLAQAGQATYTDFTGSPYRSGDYSGIGIDPVDGTFWGANEYATSAATNNWGTFIVNFGNPITPPPPGKNLIGRYLPQRWITELTDAGWVYTGNITIFNRTGKNISGPLEAAILNLPLGVTVENPSGYTSSGVPFLSLPGNGSLPNNEPIRLRIRLRNPFQLPLGTFYTGFLIQLVPLGS